jgi:hypothetical protein
MTGIFGAELRGTVVNIVVVALGRADLEDEMKQKLVTRARLRGGLKRPVEAAKPLF